MYALGKIIVDPGYWKEIGLWPKMSDGKGWLPSSLGDEDTLEALSKRGSRSASMMRVSASGIQLRTQGSKGFPVAADEPPFPVSFDKLFSFGCLVFKMKHKDWWLLTFQKLSSTIGLIKCV